MENIEGEYKIKIWKEKDPLLIMEDMYIAEITDNAGGVFHTNGNYEEIFYMVSDCLATVFDVKIPTWKRWIIKLCNIN